MEFLLPCRREIPFLRATIYTYYSLSIEPLLSNKDKEESKLKNSLHNRRGWHVQCSLWRNTRDPQKERQFFSSPSSVLQVAQTPAGAPITPVVQGDSRNGWSGSLVLSCYHCYVFLRVHFRGFEQSTPICCFFLGNCYLGKENDKFQLLHYLMTLCHQVLLNLFINAPFFKRNLLLKTGCRSTVAFWKHFFPSAISILSTFL